MSSVIHFFAKHNTLNPWQNLKIFKTCLVLALSCCLQVMLAQWEDAGNAYYRNGKPKFSAVKRGVDTLEIKTYYKNGQLKDSIWLNVANRDEQPFGTNKRYYSNGRLQSIIKYGKNDQEYVSYEYRKNGLLERYTQRPTGLTKFYNRKGKQIREYDYNNLVDVYVPGRYKNGRHLKGTGFLERIKFSEMKLLNPQTQKRIRSGILISLKLKSDTNLLTQCLIEGFSKDSIYISKFYYNPNYRRSNDFDILKYELTQALPLSKVESIYYTRHKNSRRHFGALVAYVVGYDVLFIPLATSPLFIRSVGDGTADVQKVALAYGALVAVGLPVVYWGRHLLKTTVPKKYDLNTWTADFPE